MSTGGKWKRIVLSDDCASSSYMIAGEWPDEQQQKDLLYQTLGPIFFGDQEAADTHQLDALFQKKYGIDVTQDFCEGDEHYDEYQEAKAAIAEGLSIYGGKIVFDENVLADLAEKIWGCMEQEDGKRGKFKRINTLLEE